MKGFFIILILLCAELTADLKSAQKEAEEWTKAELKKVLSEGLPPSIVGDKKLGIIAKGKCASNSLKQDVNYSVLVFLSFSAPESIWINLSKELEKHGGTIVIRGVPQNSFRALSSAIQNLSKKGVNAPVQINPRLFKKYDVTVVPTIVFVDEDKFDKIAGNISLSYAIEQASQRGETDTASRLTRK